jgi:UDP-N-acetylmuramate dehydrogenase
MSWWKELKGKVKLNYPLKNHTTFKIGGPAKFFFEPEDIKDLKLLLSLSNKHKIPFFVLGAGSNILVNDKGINGITVRLNSPYFKKIIFKNSYLETGSGAMLNQVLRFAAGHSLSGIEFLAGIPGTVGGSLVMNAGIPGENIGDVVEKIMVMDYKGNIKTLNKKYIEFGYRSSNLSKYIILKARLKLIKEAKKKIKHNITRYLSYRVATEDLSLPSAGCIFKNPRAESAGRLIDLCGLKGKRIGGACVSLKHANFILNLKCAKAGDVLKLMDLIKKRVKNKFNINLETEIKIWK